MDSLSLQTKRTPQVASAFSILWTANRRQKDTGQTSFHMTSGLKESSSAVSSLLSKTGEGASSSNSRLYLPSTSGQQPVCPCSLDIRECLMLHLYPNWSFPPAFCQRHLRAGRGGGNFWNRKLHPSYSLLPAIKPAKTPHLRLPN